MYHLLSNRNFRNVVVNGKQPIPLTIGYVYTGPVRNRSKPNRTGSVSVYMELFGTGPGVYTGPFWNWSGSDPILDLQNSRSSFGSVPDRFRSRVRLRLHGTGPEPFRTEPDRIGFCLHGTVWNRSRCLHGTFVEPVRIGSDTGPAKQQVQFWIRSGPVPERSRVNRRPIRSENRTGSVPDRSRVNIA